MSEDQATLIEDQCPLRISRDTRAGCCTWDTFLFSFAAAFARWFDVPPTTQQWRTAKRDWESGNTGWEAAHNARQRALERADRGPASAKDNTP